MANKTVTVTRPGGKDGKPIERQVLPHTLPHWRAEGWAVPEPPASTEPPAQGGPPAEDAEPKPKTTKTAARGEK